MRPGRRASGTGWRGSWRFSSPSTAAWAPCWRGLRSLTFGYAAPEDACESYRSLYDGLLELEADTHLHVHLENARLIPAVASAVGLPAPR